MARAAPRIHFVLEPRATHWPDIDALGERDIERMPARFVGGRNSWIAQTFVRLRAAIEARGWIASAGPGFPDGAVCIAHRDDVNGFAVRAHLGFLLVVRADRAPARACDLAIVQNGLALERHERFLPFGRNPASSRATRGAERASSASLTTAALRPRRRGSPIRHSSLRCERAGYIEIRSAADVLAALDVLRAYPRLYAAMVENGRKRARGFTVDAVRERWMALLEKEVVPASLRPARAPASRRAWFLHAMARQKVLSRAHRLHCSTEAWRRSGQRLVGLLRERLRALLPAGGTKAGGATRKSAAG